MHGTTTPNNYTVVMYHTHEGEYNHGGKEDPPEVEIVSPRGQPATKGRGSPCSRMGRGGGRRGSEEEREKVMGDRGNEGIVIGKGEKGRGIVMGGKEGTVIGQKGKGRR